MDNLNKFKPLTINVEKMREMLTSSLNALPTPVFSNEDFCRVRATVNRSLQGIARNRKPNLAMLVGIAAITASMQNPVSRVTGTGALKEEVKRLEKILQRHPGRNDIKLQIMKLRGQIREIEAENAEAHKAAKKVKKRK